MSAFLQSNNDFDVSFTVVSDTPTCTAQKLTNLLKFVRGEWFADVRLGTPWFQYVLGVKAPNMKLLKQLLQKVLLSAPDVVTVTDLTLTLDKPTRSLGINFTVTTSDGTSLTTTVPFIISPGTNAAAS